MSFSSAETRPFIPQPSPLLTEVDPGPIQSGDDQARPELKVIIQPPLAPQSVETGTWRSQPRIGDGSRSESRRRYRSGPNRWRGATSLGEAGSDAPQQNQPPNIGHRASFGHAMPADLNSMIYTPNLDDTFNRGAVPLDDIKEASERYTITPENILGRPPTPPLQKSARHINRIGNSQTSHEKHHGNRNTAPTHPLSGQFDGESAAVGEINPPHIAKTFVRPIPPLELLDFPVLFNPRVTMNVATSSPLYVGGGCVDGRLNIHIRGTRLDDIRIGRVGIDIVGVEEISFFRKTIFMSIASELIDDEHPPPPAILLPTDFDQKSFWKVKPSRSFLPFRLNLPLNVGPGPFNSVRARIRYIIHGTVMYTVNGSKSIVRCCRDIRVISALDPERALLPLETPLLTTEEGPLRWGGYDTLKVTAGLHRAVWVSGTVAYVDVNIVNNTRRRVNTIRLKLRRHILAYKNTVALAENKSAGHLRVPSWIEHKTLAQSELNVGRRWKGVKGNQLDVVTCEIEIPRNQLSVKMGRFFEVKYFVDVAVCTLAARTIRCQLPLTIIHMNSLDIMPNHLLQVAEAFGEKYGTGRGYNIAGRAFTAPRESALIPERKGSLRHKHSHTKPKVINSTENSSGRSSEVLIQGLKEKKPSLDSTSKMLAAQRKRKITLEDPRKLDIDVPSLGPGDPWAAGMGPDQQREIRQEQQKQYHDAERRRSSAVSALGEGSRVSTTTMRGVSKDNEIPGRMGGYGGLLKDSLI